MTKYISKDALVAEIENRIKETESMQPKFDQFWAGQISAFKGVLKILDTLEMKEVDLDAEVEDYIENTSFVTYDLEDCDIKMTAKHLFELGMQQSKNHNNNEE